MEDSRWACASLCGHSLTCAPRMEVNNCLLTLAEEDESSQYGHHAGGHSQSGTNGRENGNQRLNDEFPGIFLAHYCNE